MIRVLRADVKDEDRTHAMSPRLLDEIIDACIVYNPRYVYVYTLCKEASISVGLVFEVEYSLEDIQQLRPIMLAIVSRSLSHIKDVAADDVVYARLDEGKVFVTYKCDTPSACKILLENMLDKLDCKNTELEYYVVLDQLEEALELIRRRHWRGRYSN